jgi:hypothetical protein
MFLYCNKNNIEQTNIDTKFYGHRRNTNALCLVWGMPQLQEPKQINMLPVRNL